LDIEVCLIDVAVIVAVPTALTVIVTDVVVVTQAGAASGLGQAAPEQVQVTPAPESFVVVTLMVIFWPLSIANAEPPGKLIVTVWGPALALQLPRRIADRKISPTGTYHGTRRTVCCAPWPVVRSCMDPSLEPLARRAASTKLRRAI
jgi:hypothetical protein